MTQSLINGRLTPIPFPHWSLGVVLFQPYVDGYYHLHAAISKGQEGKAPKPLQRALHSITGLSLLIPIINIVIYIALRSFSPSNPRSPLPVHAPTPNLAIGIEVWQKSIVSQLDASHVDIEACKKLLSTGSENSFLDTPITLFVAEPILFRRFCMSSRYTELIPHYMGLQFNPALQDDKGNTGLIWAIANANNTTALRVIEMAKSNLHLNMQGLFGNTALHLAVAKGYINVDCDGKKLDIPNSRIIQALILKKCDVNLPNEFGHTPLHLACARRDYETIKLLLAAGADASKENNDKQTPQDLLRLKHADAYELLRKTASFLRLDERTYEESENIV